MQTNTAINLSKFLVSERDYKGLPVNAHTATFMEGQLERTLQTIDGAMNESPSLIWSCFELHLPANRPTWLEYYSNNVVTKFLTSLKHRAVWKQNHLNHGKTVKRKANIDFVWDKDISRNGKPFYRVMLLLNREAYNNQGAPYYTDEETLLYRLYSTWARELNISEAAARKLIQFSGKKISFIRNGSEDLAMVFEKASILCRVPTEDHGMGCHGFGASR